MPTFSIDAPNGKSYSIEGENAEGALAALRKHLGDSGAQSKSQPSIANAVTDIPGEIANEFSAGVQKVRALSGRGENQGMIDGLMTLPRAVGGAVQAAFSPVMGAAKSVGGHLMAQGEHAVGSLIAPEIAAKDDLSKMYDTAKGDVELAMAAAAPKRSVPVNAIRPSIQELEQAYRNVRNSPEVKGASVPIEDVGGLANTAEQELLARGNRPTPGSAPRTFNEIDRLKPPGPSEVSPQRRLQAEMNWESIPEQPRVTQASVDDLLAAKRAFGRVAGEQKPFPQMGPTEDAAAASNVIPKIDEIVETAAPGMQEANKNWSGAQAAKAIDARFQKAEMGAKVNNSGMNIGNKIRQQAFQIYNSPAARRGLNEDELGMLKELAEGTPTRNAVRWFSNVLGGGGGLGAEVTGDIASRNLGPIGWVFSPIGKVLKHVENHMTTKAAEKISGAIRGRTPLGKAFESSAEKWNEAQSKFAVDPGPKSYAALSISSRNLANTLSASGVKVDIGQLMRPMQGPVPAGAEGEQQ